MPQVSHAAYERVRTAARALDAAKEERLRPWSWEQPDGTVRLAPGFLLEYTPFTKGYVRGAVGISPKHTLSIIALDGARAHEIAALAHDMQHAVERTFGVVLVREVEYLGAFAHDA
jgi:UDP-N-acetylmuramate dehydrogenase